MRLFAIVPTLLVLPFVFANAASATSYTYSNYSVADEQPITITAPNNVSGGAGQITLYGSGPDAGINIAAWCLDVYDYLQSSGTYTVTGLTTSGSGGSNPTLSLTQIGEIGGLILQGNSFIANNTDSPLASAAIQIAIWMVEYSNFSSNISSSSALGTLAWEYYNYITNGTWGRDVQVSLLSEANNQDLAFIDPNFSLPGTPIPGTLFLFAGGLGLIGMVGARKRRNGRRLAKVMTA
jgi:hypothetical protein